MADDAAVLIGVGAIIVVGVGIYLLARRQGALGGGGGIFGTGGLGGGGGGGAIVPSVGNCVDTVGTDGSPITCFGVLCNGVRSSWCGARGTSCATLRAQAVSRCTGATGGGGGTTQQVNCGDCNHLNCAGVSACLDKCPPFNPSILQRCGIANIGGSIISPGTPGTGGRPTTGGALLPCICDTATRNAKCPGLCSCTACWFYKGTQIPCQPLAVDVSDQADICAGKSTAATPGFDITSGISHPTTSIFAHVPTYNRVFYNPNDQMRLVIAS
jgi:hypothetical protein